MAYAVNIVPGTPVKKPSPNKRNQAYKKAPGKIQGAIFVLLYTFYKGLIPVIIYVKYE
jgi:hypothetical protein